MGDRPRAGHRVTARLFGAVLCLGAAAGLGVSLARAEREKTARLSGLLRLLRAIRDGIADFRLPLDRLYAGFSDPALEKCGFLPILRRDGFAPAVTASRAALALPREAEDALLAFGAGIGAGFADGQVALCDGALAALEKAHTARLALAPGRERAAAALPLLAGLALLLLLW